MRLNGTASVNSATIMVGCVALSMSAVAWAALGQPAASIAQDGTPVSQPVHRLKQTLPTTVNVQSVQTTMGALVTEYIASGVVFAVTWQGAMMPNLHQLLGEQAFQAVLAQQVAQHHGAQNPANIHTADYVVQTWGHMGSLHGMAYLPTLMPAGFDASNLGE